MIKEKLRSEVEEKYKWDLTTIYKSDDDWNNDYKEAEKLIEEVVKYKDSYLKSADNLLQFFKYDEKTDRLLSKLYYYAHLNYDSNTLDDKYNKMLNKIRDLYEKYGRLSSFVVPNILKEDYSLFESYYKDNKELLEYKFLIDDIYRYKSHTLDEKTEELLSGLSKCFSSSEDIYESLTDSDLTFGIIKDENNNDVELNESNYSIYIKSKDRRVRKDAFTQLFSKYQEFKNTIAATFSGNVEANCKLARVRGYDSALSSSLFDDNIDPRVYDNLINTVNNNLSVLYKYYDLKKKILNLDELHLYDTYVDMIKESNDNYSYEDAKELVINALSILGDDYIKVIKRAFDERWIDVYHNKGKRSGAYSSGFYDINPFVLLNFEGKLNDVSTIAHELGHSMHTYFSCKNNKYQYSSYKIFVAEVASTVNELLLANYLLKKLDKKEEKLNILNHLMELYKATIFRQTMFAEFEKVMYEKREEGEILTSSFMCDYYFELVKKYFGDNVVVDDLIRYEWQRIPHFYYDFYVYKYATGLSAATYIVDGILNNKKDAIENYFKFLKSGGSMYPLDELKLAGVDMNDSKVVESAINMFDKIIDDFNELYSS